MNSSVYKGPWLAGEEVLMCFRKSATLCTSTFLATSANVSQPRTPTSSCSSSNTRSLPYSDPQSLSISHPLSTSSSSLATTQYLRTSDPTPPSTPPHLYDDAMSIGDLDIGEVKILDVAAGTGLVGKQVCVNN